MKAKKEASKARNQYSPEFKKQALERAEKDQYKAVHPCLPEAWRCSILSDDEGEVRQAAKGRQNPSPTGMRQRMGVASMQFNRHGCPKGKKSGRTPPRITGQLAS